MSTPPETPGEPFDEREWRNTVVEVEQLRQEYERRLSDAESEHDERAIGRLWLRLWQAERRRDELLRRRD